MAGKHDVDLLTISHAHPDHAYTRSITAGLTLTRPGEYEHHGVLVTGVRTFHDGERGAERGENIDLRLSRSTACTSAISATWATC